MLCLKSLTPAKIKGVVYSLSTLVAGQDSFLGGLGFCSGGECSRRTAQETSLLIFDAKSFVKLRGQEARLLCMALLPRQWMWGRAQEVKTCFLLKKIASVWISFSLTKNNSGVQQASSVFYIICFKEEEGSFS